jgi:hypothetical protein
MVCLARGNPRRIAFDMLGIPHKRWRTWVRRGQRQGIELESSSTSAERKAELSGSIYVEMVRGILKAEAEVHDTMASGILESDDPKVYVAFMKMKYPHLYGGFATEVEDTEGDRREISAVDVIEKKLAFILDRPEVPEDPED